MICGIVYLILFLGDCKVKDNRPMVMVMVNNQLDMLSNQAAASCFKVLLDVFMFA